MSDDIVHICYMPTLHNDATSTGRGVVFVCVGVRVCVCVCVSPGVPGLRIYPFHEGKQIAIVAERILIVKRQTYLLPFDCLVEIHAHRVIHREVSFVMQQLAVFI